MNVREQFVSLVAKALGVKTPIDAMDVMRASGQSVVTSIPGAGPAGWMAPGDPINPQQPGVAGRRFDFPVGVNLRYTPRGDEYVTFAQLRSLGDSYDLLRLLIETRKDQMVKFKWAFAPIDEKAKPDARCDQLNKFFKFPDGRTKWQSWLRMLMEELFVTDAPCLYPIMTRGGDVHAMEIMDGTTIKPVVDQFGRRPDPPYVAFQQVLKGIPAVDYHADELIYSPRNVRVNRLYGYSPVEQIIMTVNIALRRQLSQLQAYTEGNIPEALMSVPATWNADQIAKYQEYWDALIAGDTAARRHMKFVPDGLKYYPTKEALLKDPFDEWLARVCCYAFSVPPQAFVKEMNRATSESAKEAAQEEGLEPILEWVKDLMDIIVLKYFGYDDIEFQWKDEEPIDPAEIADVHDKYLRNGTLSLDEVRADLGRAAVGMPNAIYTANGAVLVEHIANQPDPAEVQQQQFQAAQDAKAKAKAGPVEEAVNGGGKQPPNDDTEKLAKIAAALSPEITINAPVTVSPPDVKVDVVDMRATSSRRTITTERVNGKLVARIEEEAQ